MLVDTVVSSLPPLGDALISRVVYFEVSYPRHITPDFTTTHTRHLTWQLSPWQSQTSISLDLTVCLLKQNLPLSDLFVFGINSLPCFQTSTRSLFIVILSDMELYSSRTIKFFNYFTLSKRLICKNICIAYLSSITNFFLVASCKDNLLSNY